MKRCLQCGSSRPIYDFYKHDKMADGHLNQCKECVKTNVAIYRIDNIVMVRSKQKSSLCSKKRDALDREHVIRMLVEASN